MAVGGTLRTVTWRQAIAALAATVVLLAGLFVIVRSDGQSATDAAASRATRWFVHEPTGRVVLVDGFGGRALAKLDAAPPDDQLFVAEGADQAFVLDDTSGQARSIDSADLRLGPPQAIGALGDGVAMARAGSSGLLVANPETGDASFVPTGADPVEVAFEADSEPGVDTTETVALAPDGSVWSLFGGALRRSTTVSAVSEDLGLGDAALSLVGNEPLVVDRDRVRVRVGDGSWFELPDGYDGSDVVVQRPGPQDECGWVGSDDDLWCVSHDGLERQATIAGLDIDGGDILAIAGDAAAVVERGPSRVVRFDWRDESALPAEPFTVDDDALLDVTATTDVIWVDERDGDFVWTIQPWGFEAIDKGAPGILVIDEEGEVVDSGSEDGETGGPDDDLTSMFDVREPDDNGIDDPPVAVDDPVTARSGGSVPVAVTANDYDPDGEAVAVADVDDPGHGTVEIKDATTVVYTPRPDYVGTDEFRYTIVDGDGTPATARVIVELLPSDAVNQPPIGADDTADTGPGVPVVVDVLRNDIDPERDGLRIQEGFLVDPGIGDVTLTRDVTDQPALQFTPAAGLEGTARFSYRPVDTYGAVGDEVEVAVEIARPGDENRPPTLRPDALRVRRNTRSSVAVLANDVDPDGDPLTLSLVTPLPDGIDVKLAGDTFLVTPQAGSGDTVTFEYRVDDGQGHVETSSVLVVVIDENEPNQPPIATPDIETAVVGETILIDVKANDTDPDNDPLAVIDVTEPEDGSSVALAGDDQIEFSAAEIDEDTDANARFAYTITDGNGHEVVGEVTVTVLAEALPDPPFARDDSTFTYVDEPVTIDVLRNDGDPSGRTTTIVGTPSCTNGGRATVTAEGTVRYEPPRGRSGAFRCTYEVANSNGGRATAAIVISVRERDVTNELPEALLDVRTVEVGKTERIDVTANDTDPDGDSGELRVVSSTQPVIGTATRAGNVITYTAGRVTGVATMEYQVEDELGGLATGRVQIRVVEAADVAPEARPDVRRIVGPGVATTFDVLANDVDSDGEAGDLRVVAASLSSGTGTLDRTGDSITISPNPGYVGDLVGTYTIRDADGLTDSSTVTLTVTQPANRAPTARNDAASVANGGSVTVPVLFNDGDADGDPLAVTIVGGPDPALGSASLTADQSIRFQARTGQAGVATVTYQVSDGRLTATATLRITVATCQASSPAARSAFLTTGYGQPIGINLADFATNGQVVDVSAPVGYRNGVYTPPAGQNGNVTIGFGVRNACNVQVNGTITIDVNRPPSGQNRAFTLGRGESREIAVGSLGSDDEPLTIVGSSGAPPWVSTGPDRLRIDVPGNAAYETTRWTTTLADPGGLTVQVEVSVAISNVTPTAVSDSVDASRGAVTAEIVGNDYDRDGPNDRLRIQSVPATLTFANGVTGSISVGGNGRLVTVDPGSGRGPASFTYTVIDGGGAVSAPATVTVVGPADPPPTTATTTTVPGTTVPATTVPAPTVPATTQPPPTDPPNKPPVATDQNATVTVDVATAVVLEVTDADGDELTVAIESDPAGLVRNVSGTTLDITATTAGTFTVTYRASDSRARSQIATVTITATAPATATTQP